jgi:hypothetical protein
MLPGAVDRRFVAVLVLAFAAITFVVMLHHEAWRDEADSWLFARDGGAGDFIAYTRHGGTPGLWLLLLMPFAKLGLPYVTQALVHWLIATASVAVLAVCAPLSRVTKALIAFSYFFSYEYAVIARSYALAILLAFAAAALYRKRPLGCAIAVALLFNVNAQGFAIAAGFAVLYTLRCLRSWQETASAERAGVAIMALAAFASWWQVRTPPDPARHAQMHPMNPAVLQWSIGGAFLPEVPPWVSIWIGAAVLVAVTYALRRSHEALVMLWLPVIALAALYSFIWIGGLRHAGFFLVAAILAIWLGGGLPRPAVILFNLTLGVSCLIAARSWLVDYRFNFSGAKEMARFIRSQGLHQLPIAAHNLTQCEAVLPYLPKSRFWYAGLGEWGTFLKWDAAYERALDVRYSVAEARAREQFGGKPWLLLFNVEMPDPAAHGFRLLYSTRQVVFEKTDERYWLYAPLQ